MGRRYDLEDRTLRFAKNVRGFIRTLPSSMEKEVYGVQVLRASSSVGANYIEGNEGLTKREKIHRFGISRKESKETRYFLELLEQCGGDESAREDLVRESTELMNIFGAILQKFIS